MPDLQRMKQICSHCNKSVSTVLMLIRSEDFLVTIIGGRWESDTDLITDWRKEKISKK